MPQYKIEVNKSPTGAVSGILYMDTGTHTGNADNEDLLEQEFKEFISANYNIPINDITFIAYE